MSSPQKVAILLVNLGSPGDPTKPAIRRFLREFLGDPRVVNLPRWLWLIILYFLILPFRPGKSLKAYRQIWTEQGSPLTFLTRRLTGKLAAKIQQADLDVESTVSMAMRYGQPAMHRELRRLQSQGMDRLVVLPLYPQYSSTTTASVFDVLSTTLAGWRHIPELHFISDYHVQPGYIQAMAAAIEDSWRRQGRGKLLLFSFHGLPEKLTQLGDPYSVQCRNTAEAIAAELNLQADQWRCVYQSRLGRGKWLQPYCAEELQKLPGEGITDIDIVCPGFAVDCLETLEEIAIANQALFLAAGGQKYRYIPALNDSTAHVDALYALLYRQLQR